MVGNLVFLEFLAHALEAANFVPRMEQNLVRAELDGLAKAVGNPFPQDLGIAAVGRRGVNPDFVGLQRIVIALAQFDLPGTQPFGVIEQVFEGIEINERALELVDVQMVDVGDAGNFS